MVAAMLMCSLCACRVVRLYVFYYILWLLIYLHSVPTRAGSFAGRENVLITFFNVYNRYESSRYL